MSPLRVLRGCAFGALGGMLGWLLIEFLPLGDPFRPGRWELSGTRQPYMEPQVAALLGAVLGLCIGGFLGIAEGIGEGTHSRFKRALLSFSLLGALGGYIGMYFGQILYGVLGGKTDVAQITGAEFFPQIIARAMAWMLIGVFLGIVFGVPNLSFRRMWNGAIGGAIGGFLGGFVFQVLVFTLVFRGPQVRFLGFTIIGAAIGFFINLIAEAMKRVWVKVLIGRNEGREHVLDTPLAYVGRDELADVPVFLDPMVPKRMASFRLDSGRYGLYAESAAMPITINGQPLTQGAVLKDGDAIQFGRVTLGYYEKATASNMARPVDTIQLPQYGAAGPSVAIPQAPGVCEFCGQQRDPATGACACSVAGAPAGYAPDPMGYGQPAGAPYPEDYGQPAPDPYAGGYPQDAYGATVMDPYQGGGYGAPGGGGPRLTAVAGAFAGTVFPLMGGEAGIGRDPSQEIALVGDSTASRRHARVYATPGGYVLRDEGSSNGTWINGSRVQEQQLYPGDVIRIGATEFRFEM